MSVVLVPLLFNHSTWHFSISSTIFVVSTYLSFFFIDFYLLQLRTWRALIGWFEIRLDEMVGFCRWWDTTCQSWWELVDATLIDEIMKSGLDSGPTNVMYKWRFGDIVIWWYEMKKISSSLSQSICSPSCIVGLDPRWLVHPVTTVSLSRGRLDNNQSTIHPWDWCETTVFSLAWTQRRPCNSWSSSIRNS